MRVPAVARPPAGDPRSPALWSDALDLRPSGATPWTSSPPAPRPRPPTLPAPRPRSRALRRSELARDWHISRQAAAALRKAIVASTTGASRCVMRKMLVRKAFDMILGISCSENRDEYEAFWENYDNLLKLSCMEDKEEHKRIATLVWFFYSKGKEELISLDEYVESMKPEQKAIYFIAG